MKKEEEEKKISFGSIVTFISGGKTSVHGQMVITGSVIHGWRYRFRSHHYTGIHVHHYCE
jgi:hypothetical protein